MSQARTQQTNAPASSTARAQARRRLLAELPVTERTIAAVAGIPAAVLEGGAGQPVVLLHDPGGYGAKWRYVIPQLAADYRVIAPDLPGHGESALPDDLDDALTLAWLDDLITQTCSAPPVLVGLVLGGAIAARYALRHPERVRQLVLVDSLGLQPFDPAPEFGSALGSFLASPSEATHENLWSYCAHDLDAVRARMSDVWEAFVEYNLILASTHEMQTGLRVLMEHFGFPPIPPEDLQRINVPTAMIWGRHDLATSVHVARAASARFGWPLHVIDSGDDPAIEQPRAFIEALRGILDA